MALLDFLTPKPKVRDIRGPLLSKRNLTAEDVQKAKPSRPKVLFGPPERKFETKLPPRDKRQEKRRNLAKISPESGFSLVKPATLATNSDQEIIEEAFQNAQRLMEMKVFKDVKAGGPQDVGLGDIRVGRRAISGDTARVERTVQERFGRGARAEAVEAGRGALSFLRAPQAPPVFIENQLDDFEKYIEEVAPERLAEIQMLKTNIDSKRGRAAEFTGELTTVLGESILIAGPVVNTVRAAPLVQSLRASGKTGVYISRALENTAAVAAANIEFGITRGQDKEEIIRNIAANPSVLFAYHSTPAVAIGFFGDVLAAKALGFSWTDATINATIGLGPNFADVIGVRGEIKAGELRAIRKGLQKFLQKKALDFGPKRVLEPGKKAPTEVISKRFFDAAEQESAIIHNFVQNNPGDIKGLFRLVDDADTRLTKLAKEPATRTETTKETRLARKTGPTEPERAEGVPRPEEPERLREIEDEIGKIDLQLDLEKAGLEGLGPDLSRLVDKKTGSLPEVTGEGRNIFAREGDDIANQFGFESSEDLRRNQEHVDTVKESIKELKTERAALNRERKSIKTQQAFEKGKKLAAERKKTPKKELIGKKAKIEEERAQAIQDRGLERLITPREKAAQERFVEGLPKKSQKAIEEKRPFTGKELVQLKKEIDLLPPGELKNAAKKELIFQKKRAGTREQKLSRALTQAEKNLRKSQGETKTLQRSLHKQEQQRKLFETKRKLARAKIPASIASEVKPLIKAIALRRKPMIGLKKIADKLLAHHNEGRETIPKSMIDELRDLDGERIEDISERDLRGLFLAIQNLIHLENIRNKAIIKGKKIPIEEIVPKAIEGAKALRQKKLVGTPGAGEGVSIVQAQAVHDRYTENMLSTLGMKVKDTRGGLTTFKVMSLNVKTKAFVLDGAKEGINTEIFYSSIDKATTDSLEQMQATKDFVLKRQREAGIDFAKNGKEWSKFFGKSGQKLIPLKLDSGVSVPLTRGERVAMALHFLNEDNEAHLIEGGFSLQGKEAAIFKMTEGDRDKFLDSVTDEEWKVAGYMSEWLNTKQKKTINNISQQLSGIDVAEVENYWPIAVNKFDKSNDTEIDPLTMSLTRSIEGIGMLRARKGANNSIILVDAFKAFHDSTFWASMYHGYAIPLRTARLLLKNNVYGRSMETMGLGQHVRSMDNFIQRMNGNPMVQEEMSRWLWQLHNRTKAAKIILNEFTAMKQSVSLVLAGDIIDMKYVKRSAGTLVTEQTIKEMWKNPQLRDRLEGSLNREFGEMIKGGGTRAFFTGEKTTPQKFSVMIRWGDTQAIGRIWNAAKMQIRADTDLKGDAFMAAVEDLTLKVVNETQPTYHMKDRSDIGMSTNLFLREATSFSTQTNKIFNMVYKSMYRFAASDKTPEDRKKLYKTLFVVAVNMALVSMIDEARERFRKRKSSGRQLLANYMRNVVGTIYFAPLFWPSAASKIQRGTFAGWDISTPTLSTADSFIDGVAELWLGIEDIFTKEVYQSGKNEGKSKAAVQLKRAFLNISDTITTVMMGVPVARPAKDIGLLVEYASGLVDSLEITGAEGVPSSRGGPPRNPLQPFSPLKPLKPLPPLKALKPLKPLR